MWGTKFLGAILVYNLSISVGAHEGPVGTLQRVCKRFELCFPPDLSSQFHFRLSRPNAGPGVHSLCDSRLAFFPKIGNI